MHDVQYKWANNHDRSMANAPTTKKLLAKAIFMKVPLTVVSFQTKVIQKEKPLKTTVSVAPSHNVNPQKRSVA